MRYSFSKTEGAEFFGILENYALLRVGSMPAYGAVCPALEIAGDIRDITHKKSGRVDS
jgi:hypothetical protein